jgi:hypothetical protein
MEDLLMGGIIITSDGQVAQYGVITSATAIIQSLKELIPSLEAQERERSIAALSDEELQNIIDKRRANTGSTERLES